MRQNGTNGVTPTRRIVLGGGLSAALWRLGAWARAGAPAPAAQGILNFEAAPARLQVAPAPAEPAAAYAYAGAIPGPLIRLKQGEELRLKFANKLAEPTTLSFPGLRAANAAAGIGGLTQERLKPDARAEIRFIPPDSGFNLYLPRAGSTDASQQGRGLFGPIIVDEPKIARCRTRRRGGAVRLERRRERPDQGRFRRSCHRPGKRAQGRRRFRQ